MRRRPTEPITRIVPWVFALLLWAAPLRAAQLGVGETMPAATLISHQGKKVALGEYAKSQGKKNLLLVLFRTGTCSICLAQLRDVASHYDQIAAQNAAVLGLSLDDAIVHARTAEKIENKFPLLLDPDAKVVKGFGVLNPEDKLSRPSIYLVGPDSKILYAYVGRAISDRPPFTEVMEAVRHYSGGLPTAKK